MAVDVNKNPDKFDSGATDGDPSPANTNQYTDFTTMNQYAFLDSAYYGTEGFKDGSFLIPHTREMFYPSRRKLSFYTNYTRPVIRALVEPVFVEPAPRKVTDDNDNEADGLMVSTFIADCDNDGVPLQGFTEQISTKARLHGISFAVMDNFPEGEQPQTTKEAIDNRIMPYLIHKNAQEMIAGMTNDFGRTVEILFAEPPKVWSNGQKTPRARKWTDEYSVVLELKRSTTTNIKGYDAVGGKAWIEAGPRVYHDLGVLPVVILYSVPKRKKQDILVDSPMYPIARTNAVIFNKDAEIRDSERAQAFANLFIQTDEGGNMTIGKHNVILVSTEAKFAPGYVSPNPMILEGLVKNNERLRDNLFRQAEQAGVNALGVSSQSSGAALAWKFYSTEAQLKKTSQMATYFEQAVMGLFRLYTGEDFVYTVSYPKSFQPGDRKQEVLIYKEVLALNPPLAMKQKIFEKVTRLLFTEESPSEVQKIVDEIYAVAEVDELVKAIEDKTGVVEVEGEVVDTPAGGGDKGLEPSKVLNGSQVTALLALSEKVLTGFPRDSALEIAQVSFGVSREQADRILPAQGTAPAL